IDRRRLRGQSLIRGVSDFAIDLSFEMLDFFLVYQPFTNKKQRKFRERVAVSLFFALFGGFVELLVVRQRMRIRPSDLSMDQSRTLPLADVLDRFLENTITF